MDNELQRADPRLRRRTAVVLVLAALAATVVLVVVVRWMSAHATATSPQQLLVDMRRWLGATAFGCALCLAALGIHAWSKARHAFAEKRWPLREARLLRDTRVRHGEKALSIARTLRLVALSLFLVAAAMAVLGLRLLTR